MENLNIFQDIAERTGGDIYLGVVGPVRTGKSTFIKRLMELLVLPNIADPNDKERAVDELPQSGAGKMIMTVEPKFIPQDAVEIVIKDGLKMKVRMVDCVGYTVDGALGYEEEEGGPRMVRTPWFDEAIPFQEAAELGTRKVIADHSTLGIVLTTDGSITDIPRESYLEAEERVIEELKELGKPYIVILNTLYPDAYESIELVQSLEEKYDVPVLAINCAVILFHKCIHYRSRKGVRPCRFLKIGKVFIIEFIKHRAKDIDIDIELWKKICPKDIFVGSSSIPITDHLVSSLPDLIDQFFRLD
jgi:stage IV sporulation protein A